MSTSRLFVVLLGCVALAGCSGSSPITGTVTEDGKPLAHAEVEIVPVDREEKIGSWRGGTDAEGHFEIKPVGGKPQLKPGKYAVYVSKWVDAKTGKVPPEEELEMQRAAGTLKNLLPAQYSNKEQTPALTVEIKSGKNDPIKLDGKTK